MNASGFGNQPQFAPRLQLEPTVLPTRSRVKGLGLDRTPVLLLLLPLSRDAFGFGASLLFWQRFCGLDIRRA